MDEREIAELVVRVLAAELKTSGDRIREARSLKNELGMDSISAANAAFCLEEECAIEIEMSVEDAFDTVDEIVELVKRALQSQ